MEFSPTEDINHLIEKVREEPDSYEWNLKLGLFLSSIRRHQLEGEPYLLKALSHGIKDDQTRYLLSRLGHIYTVRGLFDQAIEIYRIGCKVLPETLDFRYRLGDMLFRMGEVEKSSAIFHEVTEKLYQTAEYCSHQRGEPIVHLLGPHITICQFFGEMAAKLDLYLKARELGYFEVDEPVLFAPDDVVVNRALTDYWGGYVTVIKDNETISEYQKKYKTNWVYLDYFTMPDGRTLHRDIAHRVVQKEWEAAGKGPLLNLSREHKEKGWKILGEHGMPEGAWFVTLHVREAGFFDEDVDTNHNRHRNARIEDYSLAIEEITGRGGWVVRIGDPSMTPLSEMERVIDYATSDFRCDWMDLFCVAEGRFYLGMPSGPSSVAVNFGVPTLGTNWFPLGPWPYSEGDIFLHKLFRSKDSGRILSIEDSLKPPFFCSLEPLFFEAQGIEIVDNTPEEIKDAVIEMFAALDGEIVYSDRDEAAQDRYRALADPYHVGLSPRLARNFLAAHPELIDGKAGKRT